MTSVGGRRAAGHRRIYVPTHFGVDGVRETVCRCTCGYFERIRHGRQRDAADAYRAHIGEAVRSRAAAAAAVHTCHAGCRCHAGGEPRPDFVSTGRGR